MSSPDIAANFRKTTGRIPRFHGLEARFFPSKMARWKVSHLFKRTQGIVDRWDAFIPHVSNNGSSPLTWEYNQKPLENMCIHYITLHYIILHYITLHYITLHTYIYIYIYIYTHVF